MQPGKFQWVRRYGVFAEDGTSPTDMDPGHAADQDGDQTADARRAAIRKVHFLAGSDRSQT